jgi:hypothetical protein
MQKMYNFEVHLKEKKKKKRWFEKLKNLICFRAICKGMCFLKTYNFKGGTFLKNTNFINFMKYLTEFLKIAFSLTAL